jgi:2-methylcitrate dehydratase PrpD
LSRRVLADSGGREAQAMRYADRSVQFLNTAPGYDEELRNSVFFERGLHATSICGAVGAAVAVGMLQGQDEAGIASAAGIAASMGAGLL